MAKQIQPPAGATGLAIKEEREDGAGPLYWMVGETAVPVSTQTIKTPGQKPFSYTAWYSLKNAKLIAKMFNLPLQTV